MNNGLVAGKVQSYTTAKPMNAEFRTNIRFLFAIFVFVSGSNPRRYVSDKNLG